MWVSASKINRNSYLPNSFPTVVYALSIKWVAFDEVLLGHDLNERISALIQKAGLLSAKGCMCWYCEVTKTTI